MPLLQANHVELYYELRGSGPSLLLMMGATGDGGVFERFAELLADEFTVVTYDRRGNGRSPRPTAWDTTSPEEQADDAIFGTSSAGVFALAMLMRHPQSVRGAILHEPALFSLFDDPSEARETLTALIKEGMESGGRPSAFERFIRFVAGDANESGRFDTYLPDEKALTAITAPIQLLVSEDSLPYFAQAARRIAPRLGVEVTRTPGTHFAYLDHPQELAETVKPFPGAESEAPTEHLEPVGRRGLLDRYCDGVRAEPGCSHRDPQPVGEMDPRRGRVVVDPVLDRKQLGCDVVGGGRNRLDPRRRGQENLEPFGGGLSLTLDPQVIVEHQHHRPQTIASTGRRGGESERLARS